MWDYNVGLVRMTPFFKCRKYGKVSKDADGSESANHFNTFWATSTSAVRLPLPR